MQSIKNPRDIFMHTLTPDAMRYVEEIQMQFVEEFKEFPEMNQVWHIIRFLRSRDFNLKKTKKMFKDFFVFRKKMNMKKLASKKIPANFHKDTYTRGFYLTSKEGNPVLYERVCKTKVKELLNSFTQQDFEEYYVQNYERIINIIFPICSEKSQKRIEQIIIIVDLKDVKLSKLFDSKLKKFLSISSNISQNYYPEMLKRMIIINAPLIFSGIWAIVKHMLDSKTRSKISIHSGSGLKTIKKFIDLENVPEFVKGKSTIPLWEMPGPWKQEYDQSYNKNTFYLSDPTLWRKYFMLPEERQIKQLNHIQQPKKTPPIQYSASDINEINQIENKTAKIQKMKIPKIQFPKKF